MDYYYNKLREYCGFSHVPPSGKLGRALTPSEAREALMDSETQATPTYIMNDKDFSASAQQRLRDLYQIGEYSSMQTLDDLCSRRSSRIINDENYTPEEIKKKFKELHERKDWGGAGGCSTVNRVIQVVDENTGKMKELIVPAPDEWSRMKPYGNYHDPVDELYCALDNLINDYEKRGIDRDCIKHLIKVFLKEGIT